jgi:hypothetical protein
MSAQLLYGIVKTAVLNADAGELRLSIEGELTRELVIPIDRIVPTQRERELRPGDQIGLSRTWCELVSACIDRSASRRRHSRSRRGPDHSSAYGRAAGPWIAGVCGWTGWPQLPGRERADATARGSATASRRQGAGEDRLAPAEQPDLSGFSFTRAETAADRPIDNEDHRRIAAG